MAGYREQLLLHLSLTAALASDADVTGPLYIPRCHARRKNMLVVAAAELPCSLKAKIATLRLLGTGRLLLVRSSTTAKRDRNCHDREECPHGFRPLWPT